MLDIDSLKKMAFLFMILGCTLVFGRNEYSHEEALKVISLIEKIQREQIEKREEDLRMVVVTEREINSYIAFRIEYEQEETLKELRLKFFENNKLEGKVMIDLERQSLPKFIRPRMTFYLGGELVVENGLVRLDLKELFLENQRIRPEILDLVIYIGSKIQNTVPFSIEDWFELPYGIKDIKTNDKEAVFYY